MKKKSLLKIIGWTAFGAFTIFKSSMLQGDQNIEYEKKDEVKKEIHTEKYTPNTTNDINEKNIPYIWRDTSNYQPN